MQNIAALGYHPSVVLHSDAKYQEPRQRRQGYTEPQLTALQHGAVIAGASAVTACLSRPLPKLDRFYFLSDVPGESSRIYMSDKSAQFFRVLLDTRWWAGRPLLWSTLECAVPLGLFLWLRERLSRRLGARGEICGGFISGGLTGLTCTAARHPYDVLRATAEAPGAAREFRGAADVLWTALRERPSILRGLYRGFTAAALCSTVRLSAQFGLYNALRYDGVYRNSVVLFLYCHVASFVGLALGFPFLAARQLLRHSQAAARGQRLTYRALFFELRRRHGVTKVFDGFFSTRPWLHALAPATLMFLYDVWSRRYTEYLHPRLAARPAPEQSLVDRAPSKHVREVEPYEFPHPASPAPAGRPGMSAAAHRTATEAAELSDHTG